MVFVRERRGRDGGIYIVLYCGIHACNLRVEPRLFQQILHPRLTAWLLRGINSRQSLNLVRW
jgi:hypothetical protein